MPFAPASISFFASQTTTLQGATLNEASAGSKEGCLCRAIEAIRWAWGVTGTQENIYCESEHLLHEA